MFTKQERIGKGSFGEVFKGIDNRTQQVGDNENEAKGVWSREKRPNVQFAILTVVKLGSIRNFVPANQKPGSQLEPTRNTLLLPLKIHKL